MLFSMVPPQNGLYRLILIWISLQIGLSIWLYRRNRPSIDHSVKTPRQLLPLYFVFGLVCLFVAARMILEPFGMWDSWTMWNLKAKDLTLDYLSRGVFYITRSDWAHPGYPIFIPLQIASLTVGSGGFHESVSYALNFLYLFLLMLMFLARYRLSSTERPWTLFLTLSPFLLAGTVLIASDLSADFPLAVFYCFALYLRLQWKDGEITGVVAGLVIGLAIGVLPLIKNEGIILSGILLPFLLLEAFVKSRPTLMGLLMGAAVPFALLVCFKLNAPEISPMRITFAQAFEFFFSLNRWKHPAIGLTQFLVLGSYLFYPVILFRVLRDRPKEWNVILPALLSSAAYFVVFVITTEDQEWHVRTALGRIQTQIVPAFLLCAQYMFLKQDEERNQT